MEIEIKPHSRTKDFFRKLNSKAEDLLFFIIQKLPERFIPSFLMQWLSNYVEKRTMKLQQEIIHQKWEQVTLEKALQEIRLRQGNTEKAPQED